MASLYEYFVKDGARNLTLHEVWSLRDAEGGKIGELTARLHYDFEANAKYISFFIPETPGVVCPEILAINRISEILKWPETKMQIQSGFGEEMIDARDLVFTGKIYIYSERPIPDKLMAMILDEGTKLGHHLIFRSVNYMNERNKWEKPRAFISHDSRDKVTIAEPLAVRLQNLMCPVWYDQFSLRVGDSLRESIEKGLKECQKCILVITPNFLNNIGWAKREYDSIFTREMVEKDNIILPIWDKISASDVYQYSPILADRVAAQCGVEEVARQLLRAIDR